MVAICLQITPPEGMNRHIYDGSSLRCQSLLHRGKITELSSGQLIKAVYRRKCSLEQREAVVQPLSSEVIRDNADTTLGGKIPGLLLKEFAATFSFFSKRSEELLPHDMGLPGSLISDRFLKFSAVESHAAIVGLEALWVKVNHAILIPTTPRSEDSDEASQQGMEVDEPKPRLLTSGL
jgi:hypothetical protein